MKRVLAATATAVILVAMNGVGPQTTNAEGVCPGDLAINPIGASQIKTHAQNHVPACN